MKTIEEKAEDYFNSLTPPLADVKGLVITAFVTGAASVDDKQVFHCSECNGDTTHKENCSEYYPEYPKQGTEEFNKTIFIDGDFNNSYASKLMRLEREQITNKNRKKDSLNLKVTDLTLIKSTPPKVQWVDIEESKPEWGDVLVFGRINIGTPYECFSPFFRQYDKELNKFLDSYGEVDSDAIITHWLDY